MAVLFIINNRFINGEDVAGFAFYFILFLWDFLSVWFAGSLFLLALKQTPHKWNKSGKKGKEKQGRRGRKLGIWSWGAGGLWDLVPPRTIRWTLSYWKSLFFPLEETLCVHLKSQINKIMRAKNTGRSIFMGWGDFWLPSAEPFLRSLNKAQSLNEFSLKIPSLSHVSRWDFFFFFLEELQNKQFPRKWANFSGRPDASGTRVMQSLGCVKHEREKWGWNYLRGKWEWNDLRVKWSEGKMIWGENEGEIIWGKMKVE